MRSKWVWTIVILALIAAMLAPVAEAFDHWDSVPGLAGDLEFQVAAVALLSGLCAVVAILAVRISTRVRLVLHLRVVPVVETIHGMPLLAVAAACSPPPLQRRI